MKHNILQNIKEIWQTFCIEIRRVFSDGGVILIFFVAGLLYPILYNTIYYRETIEEIPVAVVDDARCPESRRYIKKVNATPEIDVRYKCNNMGEAQKLMEERKIHGIVYFPSDYGTRLAKRQQAKISVFSDMSSFLFYKGIFTGANFVMLNELNGIQLQRYQEEGMTEEEALQLVKTIPYKDVALFSPGGGFSSFLVPALMILVIHQTLFFGIGMLAGTAREEKMELALLPQRLTLGHAVRNTLGRSLAYFSIYVLLIAIDLILIPIIFNMPHIGKLDDLCLFLLPFLLATIFFSMTMSVIVPNRESGIVLMVFFSIILLFLSGFSWPRCNMPDFWKYFSYIFPSTHAIQGYIRINSMGATLPNVRFEYISLWIMTGVYFLTACFSLFYIYYRNNKEYYHKLRQQRIAKIKALHQTSAQ